MRAGTVNDMEKAGPKFRKGEPTKLGLYLSRVCCKKYLTTTFTLNLGLIFGFYLMETKIVSFIFLALLYLGQPPGN